VKITEAIEELLEAHYWHYDAMYKAKRRSERDSFKAVVRSMISLPEFRAAMECQARSEQDIVAVALASVTAKALESVERSEYDLGLGNGLLLALCTLNGQEFQPLPSPPVFRNELATWGGRYRWLRANKGAGRVRSAWLAIHA